MTARPARSTTPRVIRTRAISSAPASAARRALGRLPNPQRRGACLRERDPEPGAVDRVLPGRRRDEVVAQQPEDALDPAQLHRGEAPGAGGEPRLALVVSRLSQQGGAGGGKAGQVVGPADGRLHAADRPGFRIAALGPRRVDQNHPARTVARGRGDDGGVDMPRPGGEGLEAREPAVDDPDRSRLGVPHAEHPPGGEVARQRAALLVRAVPVDQPGRVDVALEDPPEAEVGATGQPQGLHQLQGRRRAAAERLQRPGAGKAVQRVGRERRPRGRGRRTSPGSSRQVRPLPRGRERASPCPSCPEPCAIIAGAALRFQSSFGRTRMSAAPDAWPGRPR